MTFEQPKEKVWVEEMINENKNVMPEFSILSGAPADYEKAESEAYHQDLNLLQLIDKMAAKWGRGIRKYFFRMPADKKEQDFRRAVYRDVKKEPVYQALIDYRNNLEAVENLRREKENVSDPMQKAVWRVREEGAYGALYEKLAEDLKNAGTESEGLREFLRILQTILTGDAYRKSKEQTDRILAEIKGIRFILTYEKDRISVALGEVSGDGAYEEWLRKVTGGEPVRMQNPFFTEVPVTDLERACLDELEKKKPEFFRELAKVAERKEEYEQPVLRCFEQESLYYIAYATFQRDMEKAGFAFAEPDTSSDKRMEASGLYDLALAAVSLASGRKVIANDFCYGEGERFFVLTGPNQGGKTTFARSLGQLVYLTKMGLDVPAESACVPFFPGIQTHFSVEESIQTGRGKLMEELVRLAPMMKDQRSGSFVVINELFTTAANYDAQIMGKRVLKHFADLGCMGIYVTHIKELTDACDGVVSLRAMLDQNGTQTFEIRRGEAEDIASAANQVKKYRLTYEQLKERL